MPSTTIIAAMVAIFVISRIIKYQNDKKRVLGLPGMRSLFHPARPIGALLPTFAINPGLAWQWHWRNQIYEREHANTISVLAWFDGEPTIYTTSIEVARQVVSTRGQIEKPLESTAILAQWGPNLFTTNGEEWKRHRRILGSAFNANTYKHVWQETATLFEDMIEAEQWDHRPEIAFKAINDITTKFTLNILARCAFGITMPWHNKSEDTSEMDFTEALMIVSHSYIIRLITPRWMYKLPIKGLRRIEAAYIALDTSMTSLVASRKAELLGETPASAAPPRNDLFSIMLGAGAREGGAVMTDQERISNMFLMLFAGHETTARTLDATLGFLALHQDIQEEIHEEIRSVYLQDQSLRVEAYSKLPKTLACFLEASRLFPAAFMMIRQTTEDVVITTNDPHIHNGRLALPKGSTLVVDLIGMHYNKRYFPEPEEYRPSRWYGAHENDMSMFSFGSRACLGRRFALTEAVCFLSHLLLKWRIEPILKERETLGEWRRRIMVSNVFLSNGVGKVPVRLVARA